MTHLLLAGVLVLVASSCGYDPHTAVVVIEEPKPEDVDGVDGIDEETIAWSTLDANRVRLCRVELRSDGTFVARNIPVSHFASTSPGELGDRTGTWSIGIASGNEHETDWGVHLETHGHRIAANLADDRPPHRLVFSLGDPDAGDAIFLQRRDV